MDLKMVKLKCLTLGELKCPKKVEYPFKLFLLNENDFNSFR